ncbi:MAG TPA: acetate--CoA ligase family protein [Methylomirabilota bacterium]
MKALDPPPHQGGFEKNDTAIDVAAVKAWRSTVAEVTSGQLGLADLASLLTAYGVPMGPMGKAKSPEEAVTIAECMGFPVALKVLSPQILRDPQFGPLVISGIYVEVLADTSARLAPVSPDEARTMLSELELARLLRGVRGEAPVDLAAAAKAVSSLSRLIVDFPELQEVEVNPLVAGPGGVLAVDARARLASRRRTGKNKKSKKSAPAAAIRRDEVQRRASADQRKPRPQGMR